MAYHHKRGDTGISLVCVLGAVVLVLAVWFLATPRGGQCPGALEFWKRSGAKPKAKAAPKPVPKTMAPRPLPTQAVTKPMASPSSPRPKPKPKAGVRVTVKAKAAPSKSPVRN